MEATKEYRCGSPLIIIDGLAHLFHLHPTDKHLSQPWGDFPEETLTQLGKLRYGKVQTNGFWRPYKVALYRTVGNYRGIDLFTKIVTNARGSFGGMRREETVDIMLDFSFWRTEVESHAKGFRLTRNVNQTLNDLLAWTSCVICFRWIMNHLDSADPPTSCKLIDNWLYHFVKSFICSNASSPEEVMSSIEPLLITFTADGPQVTDLPVGSENTNSSEATLITDRLETIGREVRTTKAGCRLHFLRLFHLS